ncbi:MAG: serine hydrolase [Clostridia bacterium]|nr:serine hydrolase [Clostridia bacterium]
MKNNPLFEAIEKEEAPMYDAAVITAEGEEIWKNPVCHNANNSHSATKLFVATAIGMLCDRGQMSVDDCVTSFFSEKEMGDTMCPGWKNVTVRHALQHKTGMEVIPYGVDEDEHIALIGEDYLKYVFSIEIAHEPGSFYKYSDASYYLLGRIIAKVSGVNTIEFFRENLMKPLNFGQWAMTTCPMGYPICGGGFFARSVDTAKLGYTYAMGGVYNGKRIISKEWIEQAMANDYACTRFRDTDVYLKTGARGQIVAFSVQRKTAASWHGCSAPDDNGKRNDRLLEAFVKYLDERN